MAPSVGSGITGDTVNRFAHSHDQDHPRSKLILRITNPYPLPRSLPRFLSLGYPFHQASPTIAPAVHGLRLPNRCDHQKPARSASPNLPPVHSFAPSLSTLAIEPSFDSGVMEVVVGPLIHSRSQDRPQSKLILRIIDPDPLPRFPRLLGTHRPFCTRFSADGSHCNRMKPIWSSLPAFPSLDRCSPPTPSLNQLQGAAVWVSGKSPRLLVTRDLEFRLPAPERSNKNLTNTDYSRGYELANSTYSNAFALCAPHTATSCTGAAESNHASRFPGNLCGRGSSTFTTWIVLSPSSESKEAIEAAEEMEEARD